MEALLREFRGSSAEWRPAIRVLATHSAMPDNRRRMIHTSALDQVMRALTEEARLTLSSATPQQEAVRRLEEAVRVHPYAVLMADRQLDLFSE